MTCVYEAQKFDPKPVVMIVLEDSRIIMREVGSEDATSYPDRDGGKKDQEMKPTSSLSCMKSIRSLRYLKPRHVQRR